jgi:hypothetical protein
MYKKDEIQVINRIDRKNLIERMYNEKENENN